MNAAERGGSNPAIRMKIERLDGSYRYFESRSVHIKIDGEPAALVMGQDVSAVVAEERRTASDRLRLEAVNRLAQSEMRGLR